MEKHVDIVIIGAGLGGLSAACTLAKAGKQVLVLEHHAVPGGYAHDFRRGRYRFEVSLHALDGIAPGGLAYPAAQEMELWERVRFERLDPFYTVNFPEHTIDVSADLNTFESTLIRLFPKEREGIRNLFDHMCLVFKNIQRHNQDEALGQTASLKNMAEHYPVLLDTMEISWEEYISHYIKTPKLRSILSTLWGYFGMPPELLSAQTVIIAWASYHLYGAYYPIGGSIAMSRAAEAVIKENGGEMMYRQTVCNIEIENAKAIAVTTERGLRVTADAFISNANAPDTMLKMVGIEHLPRSYARRLKRLKSSVSSFVVYLGLEQDLCAEGHNFHEIFLFDDYDLNLDYEAVLAGDFDRCSLVLTHYTHVDRGAAPEGGSVVALMTLSNWDLFAEWHNPENPKDYRNNADYIAYKEAAAEKLIDRAEKVIPNLRKSIKYKEIGTPLTNIRYSKNHQGSIYGAEQSITQSLVTRPGAETPIDNLWLSGAWGFVGGMSAAMMTGLDVGNKVKTYLSK